MVRGSALKQTADIPDQVSSSYPFADLVQLCYLVVN